MRCLTGASKKVAAQGRCDRFPTPPASGEASAKDRARAGGGAVRERPADTMMGKRAHHGSVAAIVLYDGECGFCTRAVLFIYKRDPRGRFRFASLQSEKGRELLRANGLSEAGLETLVLIDEESAWLRSTAALRIARGLRSGWPLLYGFMAVPRALRDGLYDAFAKRRHRWFGREDHCAMPPPELRRRILS